MYIIYIYVFIYIYVIYLYIIYIYIYICNIYNFAANLAAVAEGLPGPISVFSIILSSLSVSGFTVLGLVGLGRV